MARVLKHVPGMGETWWGWGALLAVVSESKERGAGVVLVLLPYRWV